MKRSLAIIPIMTLLANIALLLNIPILRETIAFIFLIFIPGYAILRAFNLKETNLVDTALLSVGLSTAFIMFIGLLVNQLYPSIGLSQPLTITPLTIAISVFTLAVFLVDCTVDTSESLKARTPSNIKLRNTIPISITLVILPILSAFSVIYLNLYALLFSCMIIAALCIVSSIGKLIPGNLLPLIILSISVALISQVILTSQYILGNDAQFEFYVFNLTQQNWHWAPQSANIGAGVIPVYSSMLSITLLPAVYSTFMGAQGDLVFRILYPAIFSLVPLAIFRISERQFGKTVGLLSALFFTFTFVAFPSPEPLSLNRQIVGELFLLLSILLLTNNVIPVTKRRLLLIIFGAALAVSHYSLAYIYLGIIAAIFIASKIRPPKSEPTVNSITALFLFVITFSWYALATGVPLLSLTDTIKGLYMGFAEGFTPTANTASSTVAAPQVFTATTWINAALTGISYLFLVVGTLYVIFKFRKPHSGQFRGLVALGGLMLGASIAIPNIAATLNFSRFYAISLLFLAPCFVLGGQTLLSTFGKAWRKIKRQNIPKNATVNVSLLLVAIILGAYFFSQVGFINRVGNGTVFFYTLFFDQNLKSNNIEAKLHLYGVYIPTSDGLSASWLHSHRNETASVFADTLSETHALVSSGLVKYELLQLFTNGTHPPKGSYIYLSSLNIENGIMGNYVANTISPYNTTEISSQVAASNLIYSNRNSEVRYVTYTYYGSFA